MIAPSTIVGGRYRVVRSLGGGGMKLVYLAEDLRLAGRACALAEMVDSFTSPDLQQQAVAAFNREADMLARLANEHIPRIFDRFSQQESGAAKSFAGLGIGLTIVRHLVEAHGGRVRAESQIGRGTTVGAFFPDRAGAG